MISHPKVLSSRPILPDSDFRVHELLGAVVPQAEQLEIVIVQTTILDRLGMAMLGATCAMAALARSCSLQKKPCLWCFATADKHRPGCLGREVYQGHQQPDRGLQQLHHKTGCPGKEVITSCAQDCLMDVTYLLRKSVYVRGRCITLGQLHACHRWR